MSAFEGYVSRNPVFKQFALIPEGVEVEFDDVVQESHAVMSKLIEVKEAMQGYGIGYAGTPVAGNISYDGPDIPFTTPLKNIPWGRAVLCSIEKTEESTDPDTGETVPAKIILKSLPTDEKDEDKAIKGVCYGTTIKDNTVQLNCGFSVGNAVEVGDTDDPLFLAIAVFANATMEDETLVFDKGDTVVAVSEAIDPSIFKAARWSFEIPAYTPSGIECGFIFTARGNLLGSPCNKMAPVHTSFWDMTTNLTRNVVIDGFNPSDLF